MRKITLVIVLIVFFLPLAFAWSGETHAGMCRKISETLKLPGLAEGCVYPDRKGDFQNHICHKDWCPAKRKAQIHLEAGRNFLIDGKRDEAVFQFGIACHYISDSLQPYHTKPSSSERHLAFEQIAVAFAEPEETEKTFGELNEEARLALDGITDANSASLANNFANRAMNLCFTVIKNEMQNRTRADVPDCSSIEKILRNDCHLRDVKLSGKVKSPLKRISQRGNEYTIFYLSDGRNQIRSFMFGSMDLQDGALAEMEGTYYKERKTGNFWFYEELDVSSVKEQNLFFYSGVAILLVISVTVAVVLIERKMK